MERLRPRRSLPKARPDDQVETFWYVPGVIGDVTYLLFRPGAATRSYLSYRYRQYALDLLGYLHPSRAASQEVGGGWATETDPAILAEGSIQELYAAGFGIDSSGHAVYSVKSVTRLTVNDTRDTLARKLMDLGLPDGDWEW